VLHYPPLSEVLKIGSSIVLSDGVSSFTVIAVNKEKKTVRVRANANITVLEHKIVYMPGTPISKEGIEFAISADPDFLAVSVSFPDQVRELRQKLADAGRSNMKLILKIANHDALENARELVDLSDGIMVSRGDLGIIMPEQQVFVAQKHLVALSNSGSKPCIITTQMLYSMIRNPRPTRAEATDVANAVLDGADCVMLSAETEMGDYPIEALEMMVHICNKAVLTELQMDHYDFFEIMLARNRPTMQMPEVVAAYAVRTALELKAAAMVTITETGNTTRRLVKYRPPMPVIALTPSTAASRAMTITRSAVPFHVRTVNNSTAVIAVALERAKEQGLLKAGDKVVAVLGDIEGQSGSTNTFKVMTVI
jgi:pyruvate kinase